MSSATKRKFTARFDEGYDLIDLEEDEFFTVWSQLKQLSLDSECAVEGNDKHEAEDEDTVTTSAGTSTELASHNPLVAA